MLHAPEIAKTGKLSAPTVKLKGTLHAPRRARRVDMNVPYSYSENTARTPESQAGGHECSLNAACTPESQAGGHERILN